MVRSFHATNDTGSFAQHQLTAILTQHNKKRYSRKKGNRRVPFPNMVLLKSHNG